MSSTPPPTNDLTPQQKRELLERLLKEKAAQGSKPQAVSGSAPVSGAQSVAQPVIQRLDRSQKFFPLSTAQQRLWLLDQFNPGNPVYNVSILLRLKGRLNLPALEQSLAEIQNRHEILRVNFTVQDGQPVQHLVDDRVLALSLVDLTGEGAASPLEQAEELAGAEAQYSFDLSSDMLVRANLYRLAEQDHLFQFVIHHIIFDGWSLTVLLQELTALYNAYAKNEIAVLPSLPVQYIDFAAWEAKYFEEDDFREQIEYWRSQLSGNLPTLDMPLDKPRPSVQSFRAGKETLDIPQSLTESLNAISREEGVTLFVTMLSTFMVMLARYTAQEEIIVGTPIARRSRAEIEKLIGVFLNNLALRTDLSGGINFRELLKRVRRTALDAFAHQEVPFERLLGDLRIERDSSHTPVFQVFFNLLDVRKGMKLELHDLEVETPSLPEIGSIFDITLYVQNWGDTLKLKLVYNADLFSQQHMAEFLERYHHLLEQVTTNPDLPVFAHQLSSRSRQKQAAIIDGFSRLSNGYVSFAKGEIEQSVPSRFERQVEKFPHHTAVKTPQYEWTYETLNRMANRTAFGILERCDPQKGSVALLFDHDAPMIAGMLGALKAGKTYIPLDPHYPEQRLAYMLEDSQASVIVTNNAQMSMALALAGDGLSIINVDEFSAGGRDDNPGLAISPDTVAYILYTSGSTGQPKGVMQIHRNVLHFMRAYTNNLHIGASDRLTLLSSYSFDAAIMDIFGALLNGATLYPIDLRKEGLINLPQYLNQSQITIYHSTPTVYRYFLNSLTGAEEFPSIRLIVLGGEAVIKRDIDLYKKHFSKNCVFINGLGPTESTVSLQNFIDHETELSRNAVPVGFPVDETEIVLLNEAGEEVLLSGEIGIRSPYVALGYWQKPDITQAAFLPDSLNGRRTYRTGDMGCLLPDGSLEFRGRRDFQVKIRGHRVEVGEIETRLAEHPQVKECVVTAIDDETGGKRLAAYTVHKGVQPSSSDLRQFLQKHLPDYMVPTVFVSLQSMPLTPTGKVDRRALPDPDPQGQAGDHEQVAARNQIEAKLVEIWQDLLRLRSVGVRDNFFELGGHSLMAVHMFTRIHQEFNVNLPLATLFQGATIENLASVISSRTGPTTWSSLVEIETQGDHTPFFCVHGITGDILWFRDLAHCLAPDYPFYGLQARGLDGIQEPFNDISAMAAHYIDEIRLLQPKGPYMLGGASFGGSVSLEIAQQLVAQGEEVSLLAIFDHAPLNVKVDVPANKLRKYLSRAYKIAKNFPHWLHEFLSLGPARMISRVQRKIRLARKVRGRHDIQDMEQFNAGDLIDFAGELPEHRQKIILCAFQALKSYDPKPYPGRVTLFRAMNRPLFNTFDPALGWQKLAPGRLKVVDIASSHEGMFMQPHVRDLARELKACIDETPQQGS